MNRIKPDKSKTQAFALEYSDMGVGKTYTTIQTAPKPIAYFQIEPRPLERTCAGLDLSEVEIFQLDQEDQFKDLLNFLGENEEMLVNDFRTIFPDSLSYLMNVVLIGEIEEETGEADVFDKKSRPLVNMARTDLPGYGSAAGLMKRLCKLLGRLAAQGNFVVCTAHLDENPKWDRELSAAPAFAGKEFPRDMSAFFDLIGLVSSRKDKDGKIVYPPNIQFKSADSSCLTKWSGPELKYPAGPLNWEKILSLK